MRKYDGRSGRLTTGIEPSRRYAPKRIQSVEPPGLAIWMTPDRIEVGETATVHLSSSNSEISLRSVEATFMSPTLARPVTVTLVADQSGREFEGAFRADESNFSGPRSQSSAPMLIDVVVRSTGSNEKGDAFVSELRSLVFVQSPGAQIVAGSPRAELRDGNLYLQFSVDVKQAGTYYGQVELWGDRDGRSVSLAFARQNFGRLEPGQRALDLMVGGAVIRDSGVQGPHTFRNLEFLRVDSVPPHTAKPIAEVLETPSWPLSSFE